MSKIIEIKKVHLRNLLLSFILGFGILYGLEHFGKFSYLSTYSHINEPTETEGIFNSYNKYGDTVDAIIYKSIFDTEIKTDGSGYTIYDCSSSGSDFDKYSVKSYYYTQATLKDFKYGIYISLGLFLLTLFFTNFKIKLS